MSDDAGERFYRLVLADVNGTATDAEADSLRADIDSAREWRGVLSRMAHDIDATFAKIKADLSAKEQRSRREGEAGKSAYFQYKAKKEAERADLLTQKAAVAERLKESKDLIHVLSRDGEPDAAQLGLFKRLDSMQAQLDRIEKMLLRR